MIFNYNLIARFKETYMSYILVLYYSRGGSVKDLAKHIARGVDSVDGIEAKIRTVPEISSVIEASDKKVPDSGAPFVTMDDFKDCSGIALGSPTRFGNMAAPLKYFLDQTTSLWFSGALINKPACVFTSTGSMHGGQESTLLTMMLPLLHHGAVISGIPYSIPELSATTTGGTPYGASHVAGAENKNPTTEEEQKLAFEQGKRIAELAIKLSK